MSDPFLGEIRAFPYNFVPRRWLSCQGQLLPISQYSALFSLLGFSYGGNGSSTFGLPNLQERVAIGQGQGPGLTDRTIGALGGEATHTLSLSEMPAHTHAFLANPGSAQTASASGNVPAAGVWVDGGRFGTVLQYVAAAPDTAMAGAVTPAGGSQPHTNMMPFLTMTYCIASEGIFPQRQ
jgi:microcystin-dependent protein